MTYVCTVQEPGEEPRSFTLPTVALAAQWKASLERDVPGVIATVVRANESNR